MSARRKAAAPAPILAPARRSRTTPGFFGSGVNNFGVQLLLDSFLKFSAPPPGRLALGSPP